MCKMRTRESESTASSRPLALESYRESDSKAWAPMNNSLDIVMASLEHLDLLTGLASGFRDQLGRSTPTDVELSVSIRSLILAAMPSSSSLSPRMVLAQASFR